MLKSTPALVPASPELLQRLKDLEEEVKQLQAETETVVTKRLSRGYGELEYKSSSMHVHDVMDGVAKLFDPRYRELRDELIKIGKQIL